MVSKNPGPSSRCTEMAAPIITSDISESLNCFPVFLLSSDISNRSFGAGFFPAGIVRHWDHRNLFFLYQLFGCVFRRQGWGEWFPGTGSKFLSKFLYKTLRPPRARFAKGANRSPGNVVADRLERVRIFNNTTAAQHAVGNFLHPKRTFPARSALAAALVRIERVDDVEHPDHVAGIIQYDHAAGPSHGTRRRQGIEIHRDLINRHLPLDHRTISLSLPELESLVGAQNFR